MNVVFLSPAFPPTAPAFCEALVAQGVNVFGIGDEELRPDSSLNAVLRRYIHEPRMGQYEVLRERVQQLIAEFGRIDRVDSNGEHWLLAEAQLRDDFDIPGPGSAVMRRLRSKLGMAQMFAAANIAYPPTVSAADGSRVQSFAKEHGFPLVFKPDSGSGAVDTFRVPSEGVLRTVLERHLDHHVVQPFVEGDIVTYDGLTDRTGRVVFETSHVYDTGIMQIRERTLDGHYYSLRVLPPGLQELGRRAVAAFDIRERFFHLELFQQPNGGLTALEMNVRPPGGFTTDMMNEACGINVYALWAAVLVGKDVGDLRYERRFHTAHAGRRAGRSYRVPAEALKDRLGQILFAERGVPPAFADTMGDTAYLLRHPELDELRRAIALVQGT
jgi:hypothetical protein